MKKQENITTQETKATRMLSTSRAMEMGTFQITVKAVTRPKREIQIKQIHK